MSPVVDDVFALAQARADDAFSAAHDAVFAVFAEPARITRGSRPSTPVRVVVRQVMAEIGAHSLASAPVTQVQFLNREWRPRAGDVLVLATDTRSIARVLLDDGYVTEVVLHG